MLSYTFKSLSQCVLPELFLVGSFEVNYMALAFSILLDGTEIRLYGVLRGLYAFRVLFPKKLSLHTLVNVWQIQPIRFGKCGLTSAFNL